MYWLVCIPTRFLLTLALMYTTLYHRPELRSLLGIMHIAMAAGTVYIIHNGRALGALGQPAWWASHRPVHAAAWFAVGVSSLLLARLSPIAVGVSLADLMYSISLASHR